MARIRLDKLLVKRGFAKDVDQASELIRSGAILVNGSSQTSVHSFIDPGDAIALAKQKPKFVSRGGLKLEKGLSSFEIDVHDKICLDIGASTGGFTDCLLRYGAKQVFAVDVGHGQLDQAIRLNNQVTVLEKTNAKDLTSEILGTKCDLAVMDVSFTSVVPLIEPVIECLSNKELIVLIKPQFECIQSQIDSRGVVTSKSAHVEAIEKVMKNLKSGLQMQLLDFSPIKGAKGNIEYLCLIVDEQNRENALDKTRIEQVVEQAFRDTGN